LLQDRREKLAAVQVKDRSTVNLDSIQAEAKNKKTPGAE